MIKCAAELNICGKITNKINKKNDYAKGLLCNAEESWEHKKREDWKINAKNKFQFIVNNRNAAIHKRKITEKREKRKIL